MRIVTQQLYRGATSVPDALSRLRRATSAEYHEFWPCDVSLTDPNAVGEERLLSSRAVTGAYLLALAVRHGG